MNVHQIAQFEKPDWMIAVRSPARAALAQLQAEIAATTAEAQQLELPVQRARGTLAEAEQAAREIEQERTSIDADEVDALVATAKSGDQSGHKVARDFTRRRADADKRAAEASRRMDLAKRALAQVLEPFDTAVVALRNLRVGIPALVAEIAAELHADLMRRRNDALKAAIDAEVEARALAMALSAEGDQLRSADADGTPLFRAAGRMAEAYVDAVRYDPPSPLQLYAGASKWADWLLAIANNPDA